MSIPPQGSHGRIAATHQGEEKNHHQIHHPHHRPNPFHYHGLDPFQDFDESKCKSGLGALEASVDKAALLSTQEAVVAFEGEELLVGNFAADKPLAQAMAAPVQK